MQGSAVLLVIKKMPLTLLLPGITGVSIVFC